MNAYLWSDLRIGMRQEFYAAFTAEDLDTFAGLSGDVNPLHLEQAYAAAAGFPSRVLFGMLTASLYSRLVGVYLPGKFALLQGIDLDFSAPCYAREQLHVAGEIVHLNEACQQIEIKASIRKPDRKLASKAVIRVGFHGS